MGNVYSSLKVFGFPDNATVTNGALRAPVHVRIKPVNACNERCWYCAYRLDDLQLGGDMSLRDRIPEQKMDEIIEDLIAMGVKAVTFSGGGEPLIYPHIAQAVRRLAAGGIKIGSLTNGLALRGDVADALAEHATWVRVSIDAVDARSYATSRNVPESFFGQVLNNVRRFAARATHATIGFSFIVNANNAGVIAEFCALAKSLGAHHVKLSACIVSNDAAANNAYHAPFANVVSANIATARALESDGFHILDHYHALPERFERPYTACPMMEYLTIIGADCTVYTCQDKAYTAAGTLGSFKDRRFREFWYSDENAARVHGWNAVASCKHHCTSHSKNVLLTEFRALEPGHAAFV